MINYKAVEILKTFSREDIIKFNEFLHSPYFNKSEKLIKFYESLITYHPHFNFKSFTEKRLHQKAYPGLSFKKLTLNKLFFDLSNAAENYLKIMNFQKKEIQSEDFLRDELIKRTLYKIAESNIKKIDSALKEIKNLNPDYYINKFKLTTDKSNCLYINKARPNRSIILSDVNLIAERGRYLTYLFATEILRDYDNLLTINKTFEINRETNFIFKLFEKIDFPEILNFLINSSENENYSKIFKIYFSLFMMFSNFSEEKHYHEYKKLLFTSLKCFSLNERRFHLGRLIRYCMMKSEVEKYTNNFDKELFDIYNYILENGYYKSSVNNYLSVELFRNVLILGLRLRKFKWTIRFIKKFTKCVHPARKKNIYYYSLAEYYFKRKMYKNAMINFHKIVYDDFVFKLDLKNLMLITYYELNEFESALSLITTYEQFLSKDRTLSFIQRKKYKNFIFSVRKLIIFKISTERSKIIEVELSLNRDFPFKDWVNEKLIELTRRQKKAV